MFDGRKSKIAAGLFVATLTGGLLTATSTTADAKPSIDTVKQKVDRLYHQAEIASEHYDSARGHLRTSTKSLHALDSDLHRQQAKVTGMRGNIASMMVSQYQSGGLQTASQMVTSKSPDKFLDNLNAMASYNSQRSDSIRRYQVELSRLHLRKQAVREETHALSATKRTMAHQKHEVDTKAAAAKHELSKLKAAQRRKMLAASAGGAQSAPTPAPSSVQASGKAATAVQYAMAQVGKAYVYGAAGPDAYDCSGLTMAAWGAAGVSLPHSSSAQMGSGTPVSESQLQPGDLVFYYSPVSHVGMYIGNGMIVNAENPSAGVKVTGVNTMPYAGAVRP
ncbi:MAG: C40 family peptidase [Marmoricola sp.]